MSRRHPIEGIGNSVALPKMGQQTGLPDTAPAKQNEETGARRPVKIM